MTISGLGSDAFSGSAPTTNQTLIGSAIDTTTIGYSFGLDFGTGAPTVQHDWSGTFFTVTRSLGFSLAAAAAAGLMGQALL